MVTYICLMRGVNVGGNNPVDMKTLKDLFESLGFANVRTYINSGNVVFQSENHAVVELATACREAIKTSLHLDVDLMMISAEDYAAAMAKAPVWWGDDPESKHNAIFVIPPATCDEIIQGIGETKPAYEKTAFESPIIFWSAALSTFSRTRWSQVVKTKYYKSITIRNANTARKLLAISKKA